MPTEIPHLGLHRSEPFKGALSGALGAWDWDPLGQRLYADARFAALYGLDAAQAAGGMPTSAFFAPIHPDDCMRIRIAVAGVIHGADVFEKEYRLVCPDGAVRWVSAKGRGEHDDAGGLLRFTGVLSDITEQKRIEEQLRIAQTAGGVGTFEYVDGFGTASVSHQFCRLLGLPTTDSLSVRSINGVVHPDDEPLIRAPGERSPGFLYIEVRIRRGDTGEERWIACRGEHRRDTAESGLRFLGVIYDVTESKRAEAKLRELAGELEQRVQERTQERDRVWALSRDLFLVTGSDGLYRAANPAWTRLLGWTEEELVGRSFLDLVHPEDAERAGVNFAAVTRGEPLENEQARVRGKDGDYRWIEWTVVPEAGVLYATGRDITERKQLEEQLRQSQKMEAVGQLTGGLAHDLNNMLTGIMGGMDLLRRRIATGRMEDAQRFIDAAVTSAERAASLTHRLLAFSRRQTLDPRPVDPNGLVQSMEDMLRRTLTEQIDLKVIYGKGLWRAMTDHNQLENAILNLAINARDAMPEGGRLTIETENVELDTAYIRNMDHLAAGPYVVVSVSDTGSGMPQSVIEKAFDPFFTTKPVGQGTGLGLSMVYGFVRQTGGHVSIYSEEGRGTTVKLYLPRAKEDPAAEPTGARAREAPRGEGETVLLVEDDPSVRMLVREVLDDLGYRTIEATDADGALQALDSGVAIDLLVTDVGLPGVNGRQLAEMIRGRSPDLPVLFITGYAPNAAVRAEFLAPGMDMVTKPFAMDALGRKIRAMIEAS